MLQADAIVVVFAGRPGYWMGKFLSGRVRPSAAPGGSGGGMYTRESVPATRGKPQWRDSGNDQPGRPAREQGRGALGGWRMRPVVPMKLGNAGGGKGAFSSRQNARDVARDLEIGQPSNSETGFRKTADGRYTSKSEGRSRLSFSYALYDKIQPRGYSGSCLRPSGRSNKGAPGRGRPREPSRTSRRNGGSSGWAG